MIVGPFDVPVDDVVGVTSQGSEYSLESPCPYEQSVGEVPVESGSNARTPRSTYI